MKITYRIQFCWKLETGVKSVLEQLMNIILFELIFVFLYSVSLDLARYSIQLSRGIGRKSVKRLIDR